MITQSQKIVYIPLSLPENNIGIRLLINTNTGNIDSGGLVSIIAKDKKKVDPMDILTSRYENTDMNFSGNITMFSIFNKFEIEYGYRDGKIKYHKVIKPYKENNATKIGVSSTEVKKPTVVWNSECYYTFYVETDWSSMSETWTLLGWWCPGDCNETGGIDFNSGGHLAIKVNCGGGNIGDGTVGYPSAVQGQCQMEKDDATTYANEATATTDPFELEGSSDGPAVTETSGLIKEPWNARAHVFTFSMLGYTVKYAALYKATRYKPYSGYSGWLWYDTPVYQNVILHDGQLPPCTDVTTSVTPTNAVVMSDEKSAVVSFTYQIEAKLTFRLGWTVASKSDTGYTTVTPGT